MMRWSQKKSRAVVGDRVTKYNVYGQTLVFADGKFYLVITGYNEPKSRKYTMYEISGEALEKLAEENLIDLNHFTNK